jgi:hypothetical protein
MEAVLERTFMDPFGRIAIVAAAVTHVLFQRDWFGFQFAATVLKSGLVELIVLIVLIALVTGTSYLVEKRRRRR